MEELLSLNREISLLKSQILQLSEKNFKLEFQYNVLQDKYNTLQDKCNLLLSENAQLKQENNQLKDKIGLDSSNSSLPPSRDIYKKEKRQRPKSSRKVGGQPGHANNQYKLKPTDLVFEIYPSEVCSCGGRITLSEDYTTTQKIEIPEIKPQVSEYHLHKGLCNKCGKKQTAQLPETVQADLLGPNAKTIISSLSGFFHNSKRDIQRILRNIFNLDISLGLISKVESRVNRKLQAPYAALQNEISTSPYLHIDETGHKSCGKRGWGWIFTNKDISLLHLCNSRGKQILTKMLPTYTGTVISDRYCCYNYFSQDKRQICWSHLLRNFKRFAHSSHPQLSEIGYQLVLVGKTVFSVYHAYQDNMINHITFKRYIRKIQKHMLYYLKSILKVSSTIHAHRVARNILKSYDMMWLFVDNDQIEPTNNLAERQIRKYVVYRKKCLFTWSQRGNEFIERMISIFLSANLQNRSPFIDLKIAIES